MQGAWRALFQQSVPALPVDLSKQWWEPALGPTANSSGDGGRIPRPSPFNRGVLSVSRSLSMKLAALGAALVACLAYSVGGATPAGAAGPSINPHRIKV